MNWLRELAYILRKLNRRNADQELDEEIRAHIELEIQHNINEGLSPEEARHKTMQKFGSVAFTKEKSRRSWGFTSVETFGHDLRYGFRMLVKWPAFSFAIVLILALGIGATTAIFSAVNAVLLQPLPYPQPDRLFMVIQSSGKEDSKQGPVTVTGARFEEWRQYNQVFENIGASLTGSSSVNISGGTEADRVHAARVTPDLFATLGIQPIIGRDFRPEEKGKLFFAAQGQSASDSVVILSDHIWKSRFGSDASVLGKTMRIDGDLCSIVGVMPAGFDFPGDTDVWLPVAVDKQSHNSYLLVIGRTKTGITQDQANAELNTLTAHLAEQLPAADQTDKLANKVVLVPLRQYIIGDVRPSLLVLLGAVGLVMIVVCANIASLLLARAATRQKEMAIRLALGAARSRLIRQLLTESCVLAMFGGLFGLLLAFVGLKVLVASMPQSVPRVRAIEIDRWVLAFTFAVSLLTGTIFGLAPAWQALRSDLNVYLKEGGNRSTGGRQRIRSVLVVSEVALAMMLMIGAGLLMKSFVLLRSVDLGFNPSNVITAGSSIPEGIYKSIEQVDSYYQQAREKLSALPDVQSVGITSALPLGSGVRLSGNIIIEGEKGERKGLFPCKLAVSPEYFRSMGIPLLKGREFNESDNNQSQSVVIVSESLARAAWPNQDPLGKRLDIGFGEDDWSQVVGVVDDVRQDEMNLNKGAALYQPYLQVPASRRWMLGEMTFVVRTRNNPLAIVPGFRSELQSLDRDLPVFDIAPMEQVVAKNISDPRFYTTLLGGFSALALILAVAGLYGLISYSVTHRTHEIGVRLALGAQTSDVLGMIVKQGLKLTIAGVAIGAAGAYEFTTVLKTFLYAVKPTDVGTFATAAGLFVIVAFLSSYLPARRAAKVDPLIALRYE